MENREVQEHVSLELQTNIQLQFPLFYNAQLFPNCFGLTISPNIGISFLPNVSAISAQSC